MNDMPSDSSAPSRGSLVLNTAAGIAVAYAMRVAAQLSPIAYCLKNGPELFAGALHILAPLALAWFGSHWTPEAEQAIWGGSALAQAIAFAGAWAISMAAWSFSWITLRALGSRLAGGSKKNAARRPA